MENKVEDHKFDENTIRRQLPGNTVLNNQIPQYTTYNQPQYVQRSPLVGSQVIGSTTQQPIKGESRIEYVPYERTVVEYEQVERKERIPKERVVVEYEEVQRTEQIPREKKITDYYAVEYVTEYIPQVYQEKIIEYIPQEKIAERVEY